MEYILGIINLLYGILLLVIFIFGTDFVIGMIRTQPVNFNLVKKTLNYN